MLACFNGWEALFPVVTPVFGEKQKGCLSDCLGRVFPFGPLGQDVTRVLRMIKILSELLTRFADLYGV